eukprot:Sspe_Gene.106506::Locus_84579_Transcript_1_1_Confidence_1.000_Length_1728::g.106506::m.106506
MEGKVPEVWTEGPGKVMSLVICFGVNKGVQLVHRYPPRGVGLDLCSRPIEGDEDALVSTLGVRTDHLAFLLCPQQLQSVPESDVITVESFCFIVRYFHLPSGNIRHLAIVFAVHSRLEPNLPAITKFFGVYSHAIVREQNRCSYLEKSAMRLSRNRDNCDGPWTALHDGVSDCSLVKELMQIVDTFSNGGRVQLLVNEWLTLEGVVPAPPTPTSPQTTQFQDHSNAASRAAAAYYQYYQQCSLHDKRFVAMAKSGQQFTPLSSSSKWTYIMVHSNLPQPLPPSDIARASEIIKDVSLPEILTLFASPCTIEEFRQGLEKKVSEQRSGASRALEMKWETSRSHDPTHTIVRDTVLQKLLTFLVGSGIARLLKTYYIFHTQLFEAAALSWSASRKRRGPPPKPPEVNQPAITASPQPLYYGRPDLGAVTLTREVRERKRPESSVQHSLKGHHAFIQALWKHSSKGRGAGDGSIVQNLHTLVDYFDGKCPKEDILVEVPDITSEMIDDIVLVFSEFVTTVIA